LPGCQQATTGCDLVKVTQVPLEPRNRVFAVRVTVDQHPLDMLLDTGSTKSLLAEATVQRLHIPQDGRTVTIMAGLAGGSQKADANVDSMLLGDTPLDVSRISVNTISSSMNLDGILGLDVLRDFDLDIDAPDRTLTLYRVRDCEQAAPPWQETATAIDGSSTRLGWLAIPFEINGVAGTAVVDTGASFTAIMPSMLRRLGMTDQDLASDRSVTSHVVAGADAEMRVHRFDTIRIGPVTAHNTAILVQMHDPPPISGGWRFGDGLIGQDLLRDRRVWFSLRTGRLYLSHRDTDSAATGH
jgi:predicted aspartyl protease